jgi:hypothetical protein
MRRAGSSRLSGSHGLKICEWLGAAPVRVMARCGPETSEVFPELQGGLQIQYYGAIGASHDEQSLWVEGARGSLQKKGRFALVA